MLGCWNANAWFRPLLIGLLSFRKPNPTKCFSSTQASPDVPESPNHRTTRRTAHGQLLAMAGQSGEQVMRALRVNTLLYTRDGRDIGNAIVTGVQRRSHIAQRLASAEEELRYLSEFLVKVLSDGGQQSSSAEATKTWVIHCVSVSWVTTARSRRAWWGFVRACGLDALFKNELLVEHPGVCSTVSPS
jgi:hypothetical protein